MYPTAAAREVMLLLRISPEIDVVGDVTATVEEPSGLLAWAVVLKECEALAWRSEDSGRCYLQVAAHHAKSPIRGRVTAVLAGDRHPAYWTALGLDDLLPGERRELEVEALSAVWDVMPTTAGTTTEALPEVDDEGPEAQAPDE